MRVAIMKRPTALPAHMGTRRPVNAVLKAKFHPSASTGLCFLPLLLPMSSKPPWIKKLISAQDMNALPEWYRYSRGRL